MSESAPHQPTSSEAKKAAVRSGDTPNAWLDLSIGRAGGRVPHIVQLQRVVGNRAVLQMVGRPLIQRAHDSAETDDTDHGADSLDLNLNTEPVGPDDLAPAALRRSDQTLSAVFIALIPPQLRVQIRNDILMFGYFQWKEGGVFTRGKLETLIMQMINLSKSGPQVSQNSNPTPMDMKRDDGFIQTARTGNTYSVNGNYKGASNQLDYDNVVYLRDGGGNINFGASPTTTVTGYNGSETPTIDAKNIKWSDPMKAGSRVQMSSDLKDPEYGLMPSGKKVKLKTATRSQHFAIADDLYNNSRSGTWTWHHLTEKYEMVLVDMRVHAKHGHNGGVLLWNT